MNFKKSFLFVLLMIFTLGHASCSSNNDYIEPINNESFRLSCIEDVANEDGVMSYKVVAPYTDTYLFSLANSNSPIKSFSIYKDEKRIATGDDELEIDLIKGEEYIIKVVSEPNQKFVLNTKALNNLITYPYDTLKPVEVNYRDSNSDPLTSSIIEYTKREGGTYIYSNNPEMIPNQSVNTAFIKDKGLTGDVFMTFEHANWAGVNMYLGYELKNETNKDVYITVTNIGYQAGGTWFGQLAWYDYYNTQFELPEDYFSGPSIISSKYSHLDYAYQKYEPRIFQPTTYRLPANESFFVIGGTTKNAYNKINVDKSANKRLAPNLCANGNVRFLVTGGEVTGTFYSYTNYNELDLEKDAVGYKVGGYSAQYCGIANHAGVIDSQIGWEFNDFTPTKTLPVTYTNVYDTNVPKQTTPYKEYNNTEHLHENVTTWMTHLNPQNDRRAVGSDMVEFICKDENGNNVVIDNYHADGNGNPANTANWMIEYQEHFTFINSGENDRTIKINYKDHGTLAMMVRDTLTGSLIETYYSCGLGGDSITYQCEINIPASSSVQISLCYSLVACSYGSVNHWVSLE